MAWLLRIQLAGYLIAFGEELKHNCYRIEQGCH